MYKIRKIHFRYKDRSMSQDENTISSRFITYFKLILNAGKIT
jgi:hypothetical protein